MSNLNLSVNNKINKLIQSFLSNYFIKNNITTLNHNEYKIFINNIFNDNNNYLIIGFDVIFYTFNNNEKNIINYLYFIGKFKINNNNQLELIISNDKQIKKISKYNNNNNNIFIVLNVDNTFNFYDNNLEPKNITYDINNIINITSNNNFILKFNNDNNKYEIYSYIIYNNILSLQSNIKQIDNKLIDIEYFNNDFIYIYNNNDIYDIYINDLLYETIRINHNQLSNEFNNKINHFYSIYSDNNNLFFSSICNINNYNMKLLIDKDDVSEENNTLEENFNYDIFISYFFINNNNLKNNKIKINFNNTDFNINMINNNYNFIFEKRYNNFHTILFNNNIYLLDNNFNIISLNKLELKTLYELTNYKVINYNNKIKLIHYNLNDLPFLPDNKTIDNLSNIIPFYSNDNNIIFFYNNNNVNIYKIENNQLVDDNTKTLTIENNIKCVSYINKINNFDNSINCLVIGYNDKFIIYNDFTNILSLSIDYNILSLTIGYNTLSILKINENKFTTYIQPEILILTINNNNSIIKDYTYNIYDTPTIIFNKDIILENIILNKIFYYPYQGSFINYNIFGYNETNIYKINYRYNTYENIITINNNDNKKNIIYCFIINNNLYVLNNSLELYEYYTYDNSTLLFNINYIYYPLENDIIKLDNYKEINNLSINNNIGYFIINKDLHIMINITDNNNYELIYNDLIK